MKTIKVILMTEILFHLLFLKKKITEEWFGVRGELILYLKGRFKVYYI